MSEQTSADQSTADQSSADQNTADQTVTQSDAAGGAEWDETVDVIIVGSGGGALTAAVTAAEKGAKTLVLEKTDLFGGTTAYSGASLWLPGNHVQQRDGLDDSAEKGLGYLRATVGEATSDELKQAFVSSTGEMVELLESQEHLAFEYQPFPDYFAAENRFDRGRSIIPRPTTVEEMGADIVEQVRPGCGIDRMHHDLPRNPFVGGRSLISRFIKNLSARDNVTLWRSSPMTDLVVSDGAVLGVVAEHEGRPVRLRARRGVLIAAGGMEQDQAKRDRYQVPGKAAWSAGPKSACTGDWLDPALQAGAGTAFMSSAWKCPSVLLDAEENASFVVGVRGGIFVNGSGRRFANECLPYNQMGAAIKADQERTGDTVAWWIWDSREGGNAPGFVTTVDNAPADKLERGVWKTGQTLEEIAATTGLDAGVLAETVQRYNQAAETGEDTEFGRGKDPFDTFFAAYDGANRALPPLAAAPFYAAPIVLGDLGTKGGLTTDVDARVLREDGSVIEGLYAAGNSAAPMSGDVYPGPGVPIGTCMVFSYRAVKDMLG